MDDRPFLEAEQRLLKERDTDAMHVNSSSTDTTTSTAAMPCKRKAYIFTCNQAYISPPCSCCLALPITLPPLLPGPPTNQPRLQYLVSTFKCTNFKKQCINCQDFGLVLKQELKKQNYEANLADLGSEDEDTIADGKEYAKAQRDTERLGTAIERDEEDIRGWLCVQLKIPGT